VLLDGVPIREESVALRIAEYVGSLIYVVMQSFIFAMQYKAYKRLEQAVDEYYDRSRRDLFGWMGLSMKTMTLLAFFLIRMVPGDPIETMAGERGIDPVRHAQLLKEYGLDRPVMVQYGIYIGRVLKGDLGKSLITQEPVLREFLTLFPATIELAVCAILFALLIGIPAGILAAVKRNSILQFSVGRST
jgi:ABC-type dipeptide/oligopeptide/nickel transport system permease component